MAKKVYDRLPPKVNYKPGEIKEVLTEEQKKLIREEANAIREKEIYLSEDEFLEKLDDVDKENEKLSKNVQGMKGNFSYILKNKVDVFQEIKETREKQNSFWYRIQIMFGLKK